MLKHKIRVFWKGYKYFLRIISIDHNGIIVTKKEFWKYDPRILIIKVNQWIIPKPYKRKAIRRGRHWNRLRMK